MTVANTFQKTAGKHLTTFRSWYGMGILGLAVFSTFSMADFAMRSDEQISLEKFISYKNPAVPRIERIRLAAVILDESKNFIFPENFRIDNEKVNAIRLLTAIIHTESWFTKKAVSKSNAMGYMQLKIKTAKWLAKRLDIKLDKYTIWQPEENIRMGVEFFNVLFIEFNSLRKGILAYNAGPGAVHKGRWISSYYRKIITTYREMGELNKVFNANHSLAWNL